MEILGQKIINNNNMHVFRFNNTPLLTPIFQNVHPTIKHHMYTIIRKPDTPYGCPSHAGVQSSNLSSSPVKNSTDRNSNNQSKYHGHHMGDKSRIKVKYLKKI
ncbi:hypothetical protein ACTA71_002228 [Dictyostelium dimigraforme]